MRFILLALLMLATMNPASAQEPQECIPTMHVDDPEGDVTLTPTGATFDAPKMDITRYEIEQTNDSLSLRMTLGDRPGGEDAESYRYWLYFIFRSTNGSTDRMGIRVGHTTTYDSGVLVGPNSMGNPRIGTFSAAWDGTMMAFQIPLATLERALGEGVTFGAPHASSDGIHRIVDAQGRPFAAPYALDSADSEESFEDDFPVLQVCVPSTTSVSPNLNASGASRETPWPVWALLTGLLLAGYLRRR